MITVRRLVFGKPQFEADFKAVLTDVWELDAETTDTVEAIIGAVRSRGDEALVEYTNKYDRRSMTAADLEIPAAALAAAHDALDAELKQALEEAAARIRKFHERQRVDSWSYEDDHGSVLGQVVTPLDSVGVYVPGGRAAYPSSVLMNVIPAKVAGVADIIMVVPAPEGRLNPIVLAAAHIAGVTRAFSVGGAQAIAALAYGTQTVPPVAKIVGPGNRFVAAAKRRVFGRVGIYMIAGPSEVVIVSDGSSNPDWVAMDMFAQAEHDEDARAILISTSADFLDRVQCSIDVSLPDQGRADIIRVSLERNGAFIQVTDLSEAAGLVNRIAPEHLELSVTDPESVLPLVRNSGAIFMGQEAAEVLGDYCAGPNHVLPTGASARFSSPLGVYDFQKRSSLLRCTRGGSKHLGELAAILARAEGLAAHACAADLRAGRVK